MSLPRPPAGTSSGPSQPAEPVTGQPPASPSASASETRLVPRLIVLAAVGFMLFVPPLLRLWEGSATALFVVWGLLIAVLAWLMERHPD